MECDSIFYRCSCFPNKANLSLHSVGQGLQVPL
jgi:hypothetical protein